MKRCATKREGNLFEFSREEKSNSNESRFRKVSVRFSILGESAKESLFVSEVRVTFQQSTNYFKDFSQLDSFHFKEE
jgi:hypothetical protein